MKKIYLKNSICILLLSLCSSIHAKPDPVGLWRTYDLQGKERSILQFYLINNELRADVIKSILYLGDYCTKCPGKNKNKPYIGMTIIHSLIQKDNKWVDGIILDTDSGNTYRCEITLSEDGNYMYFHAYKGIPLFGKTIRWARVQPS